jgi:hypothetical protein
MQYSCRNSKWGPPAEFQFSKLCFCNLKFHWDSENSNVMLNFFKAFWLRDAPTGLTFKNFTFCPHCIYVFCVSLRTNSDFCPVEHKLTGFYNRDKKWLLRGTTWVFTYSSLRFVFKELNSSGHATNSKEHTANTRLHQLVTNYWKWNKDSTNSKYKFRVSVYVCIPKTTRLHLIKNIRIYFAVSPCIFIHYLYFFQQMHFPLYNTNSVSIIKTLKTFKNFYMFRS